MADILSSMTSFADFLAGVPEFESITCLTFEEGFVASKGLWLYNRGVELNSGGISGNCAFFDSTNNSKLELPYFSNALDKFSQFSMSLWFKRSPSAGTRSLADNSDCDNAASISALSLAGSMSGSLRTDGDIYSELFDNQIANDMTASASGSVTPFSHVHILQ